MTRKFWLLPCALAMAGCGDNIKPSGNGPVPLDDTTFVLVHGAWSAAWTWNEVKAGLEAEGASVIAVELPGHGIDQTPPTEVSLQDYVDVVTVAIDAARPPVVVVGHSLGGMVISQAAESRPDVEALIYVAAFVPKTGDTLLSLAESDPDSALGPALRVEPDLGVAAVDQAQYVDIFCADCPSAARNELLARYRDEPLAPLNEPAQLTEANWGSVPKFYIYTEQDRAVSPALQQQMTADVAFVDTVSLPTSHSPFLSAPEAVTDAISDFAGRGFATPTGATIGSASSAR